MSDNLASLLPLAAAVFYALSAVFIKRANAGGASAQSVCFAFNALIFILYLPVFAASYNPQTAHLAWIALVCALVYLAGQAAFYMGFYIGDVSLMSPLMGMKILFVALLGAAFTGAKIPAVWLAASALAAAAIIAMGVEKFGFSKKSARTLVCACLACAAFAGLDIIMQENARKMGVMFFISTLSIMLLPLSLPLLPRAARDWRKAGWRGFKWLAWGLPLAFLHDILFCVSLSVSSGGAVLANILDSSKGLLTVVAVYALGAKLALPEAKVSRAFAIRRLAGAALLFAAVAMTLASL